MGKIIFENFNIKIKDRELVKDLSFQVQENNSLVIVGESGSGKTITSRLLIGQRPKDAQVSGKILLDNLDILTLTEKEWEKHRGKFIAYIAQNPMGLFNDMQTIEAHGVELFKSKLNLNRKESRQRLIYAMEKFNLKNGEELIVKYPFQLSGGMLQRVMIAMMMELSPKILIADEPTSALDWYNTKLVIDILKDIKEKGTRLIVITHDYSLAENLADEILVLKGGLKMEYGDREEILKNPKSDYGKLLMEPRVYRRYSHKNKVIVQDIN